MTYTVLIHDNVMPPLLRVKKAKYDEGQKTRLLSTDPHPLDRQSACNIRNPANHEATTQKRPMQWTRFTKRQHCINSWSRDHQALVEYVWWIGLQRPCAVNAKNLDFLTWLYVKEPARAPAFLHVVDAS